MEAFEYKKIKDALNPEMGLMLYESIDSTNTEARRYALSGGKTPCAFLAETQTAGRGRVGRSFYSPKDTGIYLSLLLESPKELFDTVMLTTASAVAIRRAILSVTGIATGIKWVNDLYYKGKKISGILAESLTVGDRRYVIIGVGINLNTESFPEELRDKAGSLGAVGVRNALAAECIKRLFQVASDPMNEEIIKEYREGSVVLGEAVVYTENGVSRSGVASHIDDRGRLLVIHPDGSEKLLSSGEISLRVNTREA